MIKTNEFFKGAYIKTSRNTALRLFYACLVISAALFFTHELKFCFAVERITDDVSDSLDLIDAQNFGSLNLETGEVNVIYTTPQQHRQPSQQQHQQQPRQQTTGADEKAGTLRTQSTGALRVTPEPAADGGGDKSAEIDLISALIPDDTYEIIGSSAAVNPQAEEHFKVGTDLFNRKEYIPAKAHFEKAVKLEPANDVYLLALEMVVNTMRAQGISEPAVKPEALVDAVSQQQPDSQATAGESAKKQREGASEVKNKPLQPAIAGAAKTNGGAPPNTPEPVVKTQVFTCYFEQRLPAGNIIFNTGINTQIKKSDIDGYYVLFDNEKEALALAAFRLDCEPKKAILIVTQKLFADDNNFVFPLTLKVNNFEALNGAFRLATEFRPYQFDITGRLHRGFNQVLFQSAPFNKANYALLRVEIFVQNY
jgi:hypothetical protein